MNNRQRCQLPGMAEGSPNLEGAVPGYPESSVTLFRFNPAGSQKYVGHEVWPALCQPVEESVCWLHLGGSHDQEMLGKIGAHFDLHSIVLDNILQSGQRPKMEESGDHIFLVAKILSFNPAEEELLAEQFSLILGSGFVLSFLEDENPLFQPVMERIERLQGAIHHQGADFLAYSLLDVVVDSYFDILEVLGDKIGAVEEELVGQSKRETLHLIYRLKREVLFFRKSVWPLREAVINLDRFASAMIDRSTSVYFRDVYDHIAEIIDVVETYRDMLSGMIDIYLSSISNRMNEVMKVLTIISTIFIPLTFLAGVYGMNFHHMPELESPYGYPLVLLLMLATALGLLAYFRKKRWF